MFSEIQIIRQSSYPLTPKEVAKQLRKDERTVRVNLSRAVQAGKIQRLSYGSYANLKYVPIVEQEETDWKNCKYTMLLQVFLNLIKLDDPESFSELESIVHRTVDESNQAELATLLSQARKDLKI